MGFFEMMKYCARLWRQGQLGMETSRLSPRLSVPAPLSPRLVPAPFLEVWLAFVGHVLRVEPESCVNLNWIMRCRRNTYLRLNF
jgi:hypothetical protein